MFWSTEKLGAFSLVIVIGTTAVVGIFGFPEYLDQLNLFVLTVTLTVLAWYTYDTHRIANESVMQTELETMPIMCLYIRNISAVENEGKRKSIREKYAITQEVDNNILPSQFYIALRNMGKGPAFNIELESEKFKTERFQTKFFAPEPKGDEHAVKVVRKPSNKIRKLEELNSEVFSIKCRSVLGKSYEYRYKIIDINEREAEFIK